MSLYVKSGQHLAIVRAFIQHYAINGSDVRWGSNDLLRFTGITVDDLERLAQRIADAVEKQSSNDGSK